MKRLVSIGIFLSLVFFALPASAIVLGDIEEQSSAVWGIDSNNDKFIPQRGGIKVCKLEKKLIVGFYLSESNDEFYKQTFSSGQRKPIGFEIDIKDTNGVFRRNNLISVERKLQLDETRSQKDPWYDENYMADDENLYTVGINDPTQLKRNVWHTIEFNFSQYVDLSLATFEVNVQLVGDVYTLRNDFNDVYSSYGTLLKAEFATWFMAVSDKDGNNFFGIRPSKSIFFADNFFGWPEGSEGYDRYLWNFDSSSDFHCGNNIGQVCDYEPYSCGFGSDPWTSTGSDKDDPIPPEGDNPPVVIDPNDPEPSTPDSDPDLHINSFDLREVGGSYTKEIQKTLYWGQSFQVEGRMEVENQSSQEAQNVDSDYRIEDNRDFDDQDTKIDEDDPFDINPGERVEKKMSAVTITVTPDGQKTTVSLGSMSKSFIPLNGFQKIYFFADVEEPDGDHDISSEADKDEYRKIELIILEPPCQPSFTATPLSGVRPLVVSFTNASISKAADCTYTWNFGDGGTSNVYNPSYVYNNAGTFIPKLTASSYSYSYSTTKNGNTISITNPIPPSMMITNPTGNDNWRSDNTKHITWNRSNFPTQGNVRIDYTMDGGNIWRNIDTVTPNDGSRYWNMCSSYTVDSGNSYIRICSLEYGVCATSAKFYIDHAKGCK